MQGESYAQMLARIKSTAFIPNEWEPKMPKKVSMPKGQKFEFKQGKTGAETKYDWDAWFNGDLLMLEQSEGTKDDKGTVVTVTAKKDYEVDTNAMPAKIKTAARRRYKVVQISRVDPHGAKLKDALIIKARDMDDTEKAAEDLLRAEEKEAAKQRKAKDDSTASPPQDNAAPAA